MASLPPNPGWARQRHVGGGARILLVNEDPRDLSCYATILRRAGCRVRASSSFADGARRLAREPYDLILLDQGNGGFKGRKVLAKAMAIDPELRVLILARSHDHACYLEAMLSGALDYLEGDLSAARIVALLETFIPGGGQNRSSQMSTDGAHRNVANSRKSRNPHA